MKALLFSDEPMTVAIGSLRLREAGFDVMVVTEPEVLFLHVSPGGPGVVVVDLDVDRPLDSRFILRLRAAVRAAGATLVAVGAGPFAAGVWPLSVRKPFTSEQASTWRAAGTNRLGQACATPFSVQRLAGTLGGSEDDALDLLSDYASMALDQHQTLRAAIAEENWALVGERAHRLCGSLGAIEAREAAYTCRALMQAAAAADVERARDLARRTLQLLDAVEACLSGLRTPTARAEAG